MCRGHFLAACIGLLLSWHYHGLSVATNPGFLDFDNLPETNFSCEGKVIGGYYADTETGCQMFHVCTIGQKGEVTDIKFLCLNGTVFDQETRVCERLDEVDCSKSESFYDLNLELYGNNAAGFGIQPENEDSPSDNLCEEEDEEECKTEKISVPVKTSTTEQVQVSSDESDYEETTTPPTVSSSTTSRRPVTSTIFPSTTSAPQILQFPSSSPETIAALLALHNAFTQSLQQHSNGKDKVNPPKLTGFVESLNPTKSTQQAEIFELKSGQTLPSRVPTPFPPKSQTQYNIPQNPKPQYQNQPKPQFQSQPKPQFQSPSKPQFQSPQKTLYQSPPKPQFQSQTKPQFQPQPRPPTPITHPPVTFPKTVHTTSERFGNIPFRHSFHINSQVTHFHEPNYQDQYSDHESQPSSQPQTEAPKQYDFGDYEDDYYDEKPHSSTITPYLLHQLKVSQLQNANQVKVSSSNHGSFIREVSTPSTKQFNVPSFRSVTTPGIAIITATSTTSSSSVKTGKPAQSAIQPFKKTLTATGFGDSLLHSSNNTQDLPVPPQSYDEYREGDVRSDPFYKDVPKISRSKRSIENDLGKANSVAFMDHTSLDKLKDKMLNSVFKLNSEAVLHAILNQYCNDKSNSSDSLVSYCSNDIHSSRFSDTRLGKEWKIVIPKDSSDYLYLVKAISSSNEYQNSTSNVLLLVHFPSELKLIRDSILKKLESEEDSDNLLKGIELNSVNSSIHHRFKRVRRNKPQDHKNKSSNKDSSWKKILKKREKKKFTRLKRQTAQADDNFDGVPIVQYENRRVRPVVRQRENSQSSPQRTRKVIRKRPHTAEEQPSEEVESHVGQRIPSRRRQPSPRPQSVAQSSVSSEIAKDDNYPPVVPVHEAPKHSPSAPVQVRSDDKSLGAPPSAARRGQGTRYHFSENPPFSGSVSHAPEYGEVPSDKEVEVSTTYPFNLKPGTTFSCDDKIKGGYYADVEAECYGYFICSQGEINGPLLKSHFWCGPTTKFNQRSRTCQIEANVACAVSHRYFHLNKDILSLPDPDDSIRDSFEPSKVNS